MGTGAPAPAGDAPWAPVSDDSRPPLPLPAQRAGSRRVGQRRPMQSLCDVHRVPACKSCLVHRGVRHCCSQHHEGHHQLVPVAGGARHRTLFGVGGVCAPCPPPPPGVGGDDDNDEEEASQRSGAAPAPTGCSGSPEAGPWGGRGDGYLTLAPQSFRRTATPGVGGGRGVGRRSQSLTHNPLA